jgi:NADH-quinone oxidoreductase subunit G
VSDNGFVNVTINGRAVAAEKGRLLIDVAEELGIFVPRFCYHPGMKSVAVCRMCLVKVEGQKKLMPACATPVDEGMMVDTREVEAENAQRTMLEFLLINHPLDCPICDRAGECPLQDQTYQHGPGSSRYIEPKRTFQKALEISDLVVLDRERCVLCWRCVRFADEIAGDRFIQLVDRGSGTQILTFSDEPFDSYFSGNTIQICPVGALTAKPYRFVSRPWDLSSAPSVCAYCSVGCPITNEARAHKLVRCQALPNENVNDFWICDKGRFGYHYVSSDERLSTPLVRSSSGEFELASWGQALENVHTALESKTRVGVIAGGHLTTEDAYALSRLAKKVIGTRDVDCRVQDAGAPYELALRAGPVAGSTATLNDLEDAGTILWVGPDPKETLPVLYLRIRKAVLEKGAQLVVVSVRRTSLDSLAARVVRSAPGGEAKAIESLVAGSDEFASKYLSDPLIACWGPGSPGRDETGAFAAIVDLVNSRGGRLLVCPPHAGSQGLIDMGVYPTLDAGYKPTTEPGRDTRAILEAAANGELDALLVVGADLIADFPGADLARRALEATFTVVVELFATDTVAYADVVLPSVAYAEREGTFTNLERRLQKLEPLVPPPGSAREPWSICAGIAATLGEDWEWSTIDDVWTDLKKDVATHADVHEAHLVQESPTPAPAYESGFEPHPSRGHALVAGPGGQYPKGHRSGAPFQTGQSWPLSWELRAFEAKQRPGFIPPAGGRAESAPSASSKIVKPQSSSEGAASSGPPSSPANVKSQSSSQGAASSEPSSSAVFALYTGRQIYDMGSMVTRSAALRGLARKPFVEMNRADADALGLADGDEAVVAADGFEARAPVVIGDIAKGAVFMPYDQDGVAVNRLIGGVDPTVEVRKP